MGWEDVNTRQIRLEVYGGWLVKTFSISRDAVEMKVDFLKDPNHKWKGSLIEFPLKHKF